MKTIIQRKKHTQFAKYDKIIIDVTGIKELDAPHHEPFGIKKVITNLLFGSNAIN